LASNKLRVAVDIGGTFTDLVLLDGDRVVATGKALTTPDDPSMAVGEGIKGLLAGYAAEDVVDVVHGTTLVSNALIERKGAVTGLITNAGFRDTLAAGREQRYDLYDLFLEMPEPLVPRNRRWGIRGRVLADGEVEEPLDIESLAHVAESAREWGVESIAVCLLHSYRNPAHEEAVRSYLAEKLPDIWVTLSSEVSPEIGEYFRVSTTAANAFVLPVVDRYLGILEDRLRGLGVSGPLRIMLSTGGLAATRTARSFPVRLLESGPAAGALSAGYLGGAAVDRPVIAFDMGGTTAKAALIDRGEPLVARDFEVARVYRFTKGSGLPIRLPVIDMIEIGAGGGSIARVGPFDLPKVGPDSSGSAPGPVCYGQGGQHPTVTDADLILGYLNPSFFLGGEMLLAVDTARDALGTLGDQMGLSAEETAGAVHRVVNENMASAARMHAIERGRDIRSFTLVATGGAGPVHAWGVARALSINRIVFPPRAGVASAFGILTAPVSFEFPRSLPSVLSDADWSEVRAALDDMRQRGYRLLEESDVTDIEVTIAVDVRYQGQGDSITVALGSHLPEHPQVTVRKRFEEEYSKLYGSTPSNVEPEILTWRLRASGPKPQPSIAPVFDESNPLRDPRPMWFPDEGYIEGTVYDRYSLKPGFEFAGPAVVEERESTMVIGPGGGARVTENGNLEVMVVG
jgi:N-methylhydantoinase A